MAIKKQQIEIGEIKIDVYYKEIKNIHLSVHPPAGRVRIASPLKFPLDTLRVFAISKLSWIRKQQLKIRSQEREALREYLTRETHYYLGKRYLLNIIVIRTKPKVLLKHSTIDLFVKEKSTILQRKTLLEKWYRERLKELIPGYIKSWEKILGVKVNEFGIKKMRTRWGTCNTRSGRIWINLELAKKPSECLEYIIVHEMIHLLERTHNKKFVALMNRHLPKWKDYKKELNGFPLIHQEWVY